MMNNDRLERDSEQASLLQQLLDRPIGRRWLLKAGLGSAAALAAANLPAWSAPTDALAQPTVGSGQLPSQSTGTTLQFALGTSSAEVSDLTLLANGARLPLVAHTGNTRAALKTQGGLWGVMDLEALTHHVDNVPLPSDRCMVVSVQGKRGNRQVLVSQLVYTPAESRRGLAQLAASGGALKNLVGSDQRLQALGLTAEQISTPEHLVQLDSITDTHQSPAVALVFHHPSVSNIDKIDGPITTSLLGKMPEVQTLGAAISTLKQQAQDYATFAPATNDDGSPAQIQIPDNSTTPPKVVTTTFTTIQLNQTNGFQAALKAGVSAGVTGVRKTGDLGQVIDKPLDAYPIGTPVKTWVQSQGSTPQAKPYTPPTNLASGEVQATIKVPYVPFQVPVSNGLVFGTGTQATGGGYSNGQMPLRIYNNWVRWVWAYVQYIGKGGENLSIDPTAKWPDTQYAKSLAIVPQVFTVLGIPIWDTNTVDVTLNFPKDAHTARLLYCGLGSDINGGGWRQYFPADAYPDRIAPTDEVLFPALVTAIATIGINVFALASDIQAAAAWTATRQFWTGAPTGLGLNVIEALEALTQASTVLTGAETAATVVAAGGATYADIEGRGENVTNLWSILLSLSSIIPRVLFSPATDPLWEKVAYAIVATESVNKVVDAIPFIGEVIAVVTVVGDVATLAEVAAETIVAPWVIENEVNLNYQATVTVKHDPDDATWPVTASSWTLETKLDDAPASNALTGTINPDGRVQSDDLVLQVTAPFGGATIQWSLVVLDEGGHQVGTGVSGKLTNDDPSNPPTTVEFAITELPAAIDASTVFQRADTVTYSDSAGGYTWFNGVTSDGTRQSSPIQEVTGVTVSTTSGVVGVVWKQNDRYYVRGVPVAENGNTIPLSAGPKEGYARPPFLLLDAFVGRQDRGNHVLLEPDDTSDAYFVRQVTLDPDTGGITWDSSTALGTFSLPVSGAALHSSGRVVVVHTDTGRLGRLHPAATPRPGLAAYSAGIGTEVGLLQSPTAVAVTNPGTVLILEAGAAQLSAFDLEGNPIKYFGPNQDQFTQKLANAGTYQDLAVDGSGEIYLLYYTGDGSQPDDYHIDVYTPTGEPFATQSPGVNVAKMAVDYFRSIYAANFDPIYVEGTTTPRVDPALKLAEPSLSRFDPTSGESA